MDDHTRGIFNRKRLERRRKELRKQGTPPEALLWKHLQKRRLMGKKFRRQESIGPYIVDFYCPECRVIVELDGAPHDQFLTGEYDAERTRYLEQYGMHVIRFENRSIYENLEAVLEEIRQTLLARRER
jgi:very-short-patch-repair endonuclease